jgi:pimeloyl-ACP methyl ester carboxylesterase
MRPAQMAAVGAFLLASHCSRTVGPTDRFLDSDGVTIRYEVTGGGPAVVLVHGFGETLERWHSAGVVRALKSEFQVMAFDLRGHGRSGKPTDPDSYGSTVSGDLLRVMDEVGARHAHVVGYSLGAFVVLDFAVSHSARVRSIVLGGAGAPPDDAPAEFERQARVVESRVPPGDDQSANALAALLRGFRTPGDAEVSRIAVPVAALIGANDHFKPSVERLSRLLPHVEVTVIPDSNHATARDHPQFTEALLVFLRKQRNPTLSRSRWPIRILFSSP